MTPWRGSRLDDVELLTKLSEILARGEAAVLCTLIEKTGSGPRDEGTKMLVDGEGKAYGTIGGGGMERRLVEEALAALGEGRPRTITFALGVDPQGGAIPVDSKCGGEVKIFMDVVKPDPRLIVIGSGHIGMPVAELANNVGFEVIIVDDAKTSTKERFPHAKEILSGPFEEELGRLKVMPSDFVTIVHGETTVELTALRSLLPQGPAYIGLLGSKNKEREHKKQLKSEGFPEDAVDRIKGPIGLDIGAETPKEIAVSIVAELIKAKRG